MQDDWKTYRTRFVVRAKQLTEPFTFTGIDGREQHGRPGDYVIESREGLRISRREIFDDVYVVMESAENVPTRSLNRELPYHQGTDELGEQESGRHTESESSTSGGHDFSRAVSNRPLVGALAPVQPPAEHANLPV